MSEPSHRNAKILIIDDQDSNLRLVERILSQGGYSWYRSLNDSRQVVPVFRELQPDLVLLDLMMPHLDGVAVMEQLRPLTEGNYLPVVVLTADGKPDAKRRALAAGAKDFLTKPLDVSEVLLRINNLLETRFLYQQLQQRSEKRIQEQALLLDQANAALIQAQRMEAVGLLAGGVAHDFNNALTVILGYSDMILAQLRPGERMYEEVTAIGEAGRQASTLTSQLLAFSRRQILKPVILDLNALVSGTEKMLRRLIGEDITFTTRLDPALGSVRADRSQLEQVLMNLVVNSRDAMPTGGQIIIETRNVEPESAMSRQPDQRGPARFVLLAVTDTGCGMDEATKARIFEPFFTTKEMGKGTGLGLSTVYGIVQASGGCIEVDTAPGHGCTFRIYLPRLGSRQAAAARPGREPEELPRGTGTVLLVEDEGAVRSLGSRALRSAGYGVLEAKEGQDALRIIKGHRGPIDLLVTDVVMPRMSGRELADRVASLDPNLKVLFVSGYTDDAMVRHGVHAAQMAFLQKPFTPDRLVRKVYEILGH
jgi:signal transduction histidine kinase